MTDSFLQGRPSFLSTYSAFSSAGYASRWKTSAFFQIKRKQRQVSYKAFAGTSGLNLQCSDGHTSVIVRRNAQLFAGNTWFALVPCLYFR
jgi:hypothetical protein